MVELTRPTIQPGLRLRSYEFIEELGSGAMGWVWRARHLELGNDVAIKVMHPHVVQSPATIERFLREGRLLARLSHPHIVQAIDLGSEQGLHFLVMELARGETLASMLGADGIPPQDAVSILLPLISAMVHAHGLGIVHRDLKPSNLLLAQDHTGRLHPKVTDFGIAKALDGSSLTLTADGKLLGTLAYAAPEQIQSAREATVLSDQYSLGVILYRCLTGNLPYDADGIGNLVRLIEAGGATEPHKLDSRVPPELASVVMKAISAEPKDRFEDLRGFALALLPFAPETVAQQWCHAFEGPSESKLPAPRSPEDEGETAGTADGQVVAVPCKTTPETAPSTPPKQEEKSEARPKSRRLFWSLGAVLLLTTAFLGYRGLVGSSARTVSMIIPSGSADALSRPEPPPVSTSTSTASALLASSASESATSLILPKPPSSKQGTKNATPTAVRTVQPVPPAGPPITSNGSPILD